MERAIKRYFPIFVIPTLGAFIIGFIVPFVMGIYLSFCDFTTVTDATWVGFSNYAKALSDPTFTHSFFITTAFAVVTLILINVLAFAVALILTQRIRGTNLFRTVFFMPNLIGGIVLGTVWLLIFNGILSRFDLALRISTKFGFWGLVILICWQQIGYMMIIYIAGLQSINPALHEAANIDGASKWQSLIHVTIPNLMPSITICTFLTLTNGFKLFDQNLSLTNGEPMKSTELLALNIFNTFYGRNGFKGVGQAKAVLFFLLVVALGLIQLHFTRSKEVEG